VNDMSNMPASSTIGNVEAEQGLLGAVIVNNDALAYATRAGLRPEDFCEPAHGRLYAELHRQITSGAKVTPVTLKAAFPEGFGDGDASMAPSSRYIARLAAEATTVINVADYAAQIHDLAAMRGLIAVGGALNRAAMNLQAPDYALAQAWKEIDRIRQRTSHDDGDRGSLAKLAQCLLDGSAANGFVVTTGLADLDRAIAGGWRAGRLYILAGRPGMGKSVIAMSSARRVARTGAGVDLYSLELRADELTARLVADELARSHAPLAYRDITAGFAPRERVREGVERLSELPVHLDCTPGLSIGEIEARAHLTAERLAKAGRRLGVVFIDYLGLVRAADRYRGNKVLELDEIALGAKDMAKRLDCAVVLLSQLNRGVEQREDKRPTLSDLRQSGGIEEHADFVGFLYREAYYLARSEAVRSNDGDALTRLAEIQNDLELIVEKNRIGPTCTVRLWCDVALSAVDNRMRR